MKTNRIVSAFLSLILILSSFVYSPVCAETADNSCVAFSEDYRLNEEVPQYLCQAYDEMGNGYSSSYVSSDEYSVTFLNDDGTYSMMQFMEPIKYYDNKTESYHFIDNEIINSSNSIYEYENKSNAFSSLFSSNGVTFMDDFFSIDMIPISDCENIFRKVTIESENNYVSYGDVYGKNTELRYYVENSGLKEVVVLNERPDFSSYSFKIHLNGLEVNSLNGDKITLTDSVSGEEKFLLEPVFIQDSSDNCNISYDNFYSSEKIDDNDYIITVNLDKDFLNDESIVYPCIVDPTVYYMRTRATIDSSYVSQSGNTYVTNYLQVGNHNTIGECITYLSISGLEDKKWLNPNNIISSELAVRDCTSGSSNSGTVTCYESNSIFDASSVTYSQLTSAIGNSVDTISVSGTNCWYKFDITTLMKKWILNQIGQGGINSNYGCILRGSSNLINRRAYRIDNSSQYQPYNPHIDITFTYDEPIKDGIYKINSSSDLCYLQYNGLSQNVTVTSHLLSDNKKWRIKNEGDGTYTIKPYNSSTEYLYANSTDSGTSVSISNSIFKWYIVSNPDGTFRIFPGSTINQSNAMSNSSGNVKLINYQNKYKLKWHIEPLYHANVSNYYDNGYSVRYDETNNTSQMTINNYFYEVSNRYREILGLDISYSTNYYNSIVDQCKGTVTSSNINSLCSHNTQHTNYQQIKSNFQNDAPANNTTTAIYWTGHKIDTTGLGGSTGTTSFNRSFSSFYRIYMLELCTSGNRTRNSEGVLMHELNHQYDAPDHYHEILTDGTCRGKEYCSVCGVNRRPNSCIMYNSRINITNNDVLCDGCKGDILTHLEDHHTN